jgi:hypothetical protein
VTPCAQHSWKREWASFMEPVVFALSIDEIDTKQPTIHRKIHTSLWIFKNFKKNQIKPKVLRLLSNVCDFQKESEDFGEDIRVRIFILCDFHLLAYVSSLTFGHCLGLYLQ